jgi:hypothetical protein
MRNRVFPAGLIVAAVIVLCVVVSVAVAQGGGQRDGRRGGGQDGMMGSMMYLERSWTAVSFQLDCTGEQLTQLRPTYRNTLNARDAALKQAREKQDREAMAKAMTEAKTRLDTKLKSVLSDAQWTKLGQLMTPRTSTRGGRQGADR